KNAALLNDTVSCPEHGMNKIIECDVSAYEENGRGIVLHGCKTQCGSSVIASMPDMEVG
ncbi:PAAR domain-containing protein, partial [Enterobacter hormaechei]